MTRSWVELGIPESLQELCLLGLGCVVPALDVRYVNPTLGIAVLCYVLGEIGVVQRQELLD